MISRFDARAHALPDANINMISPFADVLDKRFFGQRLMANRALKASRGAGITRMVRKNQRRP